VSLGKKIVLIVLGVSAVSLLLTGVALRTVVYPMFDTLQMREADGDLARVELALDAVASVVDSINLDWSEWDVTYEFVQGKNPEFEQENLYGHTFLEIEIDLMLFYDAEGQLFAGWFMDRESSEFTPLDEILISPLAPDDPMMRHEDPRGSARGLLRTRRGPMVVASRPILTTLGDGPIMGSMIFGRLLDASRIETLEQQTETSFALTLLAEEAASETAVQEAALSAPGRPRRSQDGELLLSYRALPDVYGEPTYLLRVETPREIAAVGGHAISLTALFFAVTALFPVACLWLLFRRLVVTPVGALTRHILEMRERRDLSRRLGLDRGDEIGTLAGQFDSLTADLEEARREMAASRDAALEVAKLKSDFLATVSHEIRTPMNGVIGMAEMLLDTRLTERQREFAQTIQGSTEGLLAIVNDILDFSKLEAHGVELEQQNFALGDLVEEAVSAFDGAARASGIAFGCRVAPEADGRYRGDPNRLRQILLNLVDNALKFTSEGEIAIEVSQAARRGETHEIRFEIRDTGIGISSAQRTRIFESFARADASTTRARGGTGLGLTISSHLIDMMGGEIGVESEIGTGSTFWFVVPLRRIGEAPARERAPAAAERPTAMRLRGRVLLAEDNPVNQQVALAVLDSLGCQVDVVGDGAEALEALAAAHYDTVLMDCEMPNVDGFEATATLRRREAEAAGSARVPVIALTAHAVAGAREECLAADMDDYLTKPFRRDELRRALGRWLIEEPLDADVEPAPGAPQAESDPDAASECVDGEDPLDRTVLDTLRSLQPADGSDLLGNLISVYRSSSAELLESLSESVQRDDAQAIQQAAHALKSSSLNVGARILGDLCRQLEALGASGEVEGAKDLFERIAAERERALEALDAEVAR
jgi:signal transduction histidine kinase/CheY-like chemotaxis protein